MGTIEIANMHIPFVGTSEAGTAICGLTAAQADVAPGLQVSIDGLVAPDPYATAVITAIERDVATPGVTETFARLDGSRRYTHFGRLALQAFILGRLADGSAVYAHWAHSHLTTHLRADSGLYELMAEALPQITPQPTTKEDPCFGMEMDMGRPVGKSELVELHPDDEVFYAKRPGHDTYIPFVRGRAMEPTHFLTALLRAEYGTSAEHQQVYKLFSAWTGKYTPAVPGTPKASLESAPFWRNHALVADYQSGKHKSQDYDPKSVVTEWPYDQTSN